MKKILKFFSGKEILKFIVSGAIGIEVTGTMYFLIMMMPIEKFFFYSYVDRYALGISIIGGYAVGFFVQKYWVFENQDKLQTKRQILEFIIFSALYFFINMLLTCFFQDHLKNKNILIAQVITTIVLFFINFALSKIIFVVKIKTPALFK
jgi:putative flippase GtrA